MVGQNHGTRWQPALNFQRPEYTACARLRLSTEQGAVVAHKNHHFVPQFHLRHFSEDVRKLSERRFISQCDVDSGVVQHDSSIRGQCQRARLYGKTNEKEHALSRAEGAWATIIREISETERLPERLSERHETFLRYVAIQKERTVVAGAIFGEHNDFILSQLEGEKLSPEVQKIADELREAGSRPVEEALEMGAALWPYMLDLQMLLVRAPAGSGFITSDHPIQLFNTYMRLRRGNGSAGCRGIQISVPISPSLCLLLFDQSKYGLGRIHRREIVDASVSDVTNLNILQAANAESCLYFNQHRTPVETLLTLPRHVTEHRKRPRTRNDIAVETGSADAGDELIVISSQAPLFETPLSFLKNLEAPVGPDPVQHHLQARHPELFAILDNMSERSHAGVLRYLMNQHADLYAGIRNLRCGYVGPVAQREIDRARVANRGRARGFAIVQRNP
jgi:hypothetical protein